VSPVTKLMKGVPEQFIDKVGEDFIRQVGWNRENPLVPTLSHSGSVGGEGFYFFRFSKGGFQA
jgi:hypothetical protein